MTNNLNEQSRVSLKISNLWGIIVSMFAIGAAVTAFQFSLESKIEALAQDNQVQHRAMMQKLTEIDARQQLYTLKTYVTEAFVLSRRITLEDIAKKTNTLTSDEELHYRKTISDILNKN